MERTYCMVSPCSNEQVEGGVGGRAGRSEKRGRSSEQVACAELRSGSLRQERLDQERGDAEAVERESNITK